MQNCITASLKTAEKTRCVPEKNKAECFYAIGKSVQNILLSYCIGREQPVTEPLSSAALFDIMKVICM